MAAAGQHHIRGTLGELDEASVAPGMDGGHHFPGRIKGRFCHTGHRLLQLMLRETDIGCEGHQRGLGGLAFGLALLVQIGIGAEGHGSGQLGSVAGVLYHRHTVLGQGSGLIGADDLCTAQGLHCGQSTDHGIGLGHLGDTDGQHHGHHSGETLRDSGYGQGNGDHEGIQYRSQTELTAHEEVEGEDEHADDEHEIGQLLAQLVQLLLQRRFLLLGLVQGGSDLAHFCLHAGFRDDGSAAAVYHGGAHVNHVLPVAERDVLGITLQVKNIDELVDGDALAGEGSLLQLQGIGGQETAVCRHRITGLQHHDVAGHQTGAGNGAVLAVADDLAAGLGHALERFNSFLCLAFLNHAQNGVQQYHHDNDEYLGHALTADIVGDCGNRCGNHQHDEHRILERLQEALEIGNFLRFLQTVFTVFLQPLCGFCIAEAFRTAFGLRQCLLRRFQIIPSVFVHAFLLLH